MATPVAVGAGLKVHEVSEFSGQVVTLCSGSLRVEAGSPHALVGANGAGNSTLMKIAAGVYRRGSGTSPLVGERVAKFRQNSCWGDVQWRILR